MVSGMCICVYGRYNWKKKKKSCSLSSCVMMNHLGMCLPYKALPEQFYCGDLETRTKASVTQVTNLMKPKVSSGKTNRRLNAIDLAGRAGTVHLPDFCFDS